MDHGRFDREHCARPRMTTSHAVFLDFAHAMAVSAGREILPHFRVALDIEDKGSPAGYDPVTVADRAAEMVIRTGIARAYPDHGIRARSTAGSGRVQLHLGDRPDRRHQELHPRPAALGDAHRAARRRARRRRGRASAVCRGVFRRDGRRNGAVAPRWRAADPARRGCGKLGDAVLACTHPSMFRTPPERAAFDRVADRARLTRWAATATRTACWRWG